MPELASARRDKLARLVRGADSAICVAIFFAGCMPAIIVMLIIAFPLLPLFGVWVSWVATTGGPTETAGAADETRHAEPPGEHPAPMPRYA
jgi:hypothetical protein